MGNGDEVTAAIGSKSHYAAAFCDEQLYIICNA